MVRARINNQRGAVLIAVVTVVMIMLLTVLAKWAMLDVERKLARQTGVGATLSKIDTALANFVAQNKRLPCPANGTIAGGMANAGIENPFPPTGVCNPVNQSNGVVPWVTLGISETDAADPWNGRISYRVQSALANSTTKLMDMSWCDPAGAVTGASGPALACTTGCVGAACMNPLNFIYSKGLQVQDGTGIWLNRPVPPWPGAPVPPPPNATGAAYVLISHGPNGAGAYSMSGVIQAGSTIVGTSEAPNLNNQALAGATIFMDALHNSALTPAHFDDYLSHPTITSVLERANLGPRSH